MLFPTLQFLVFFVILLALLFIFRRTGPRKLLLLAASYVFYMAWNPAFILLILASTAIDYLLGPLIHGASDIRRRRMWLALSICANLGFLAYFKYAGLLSATLLYFARLASPGVDWQLWDITLPVGISFYTFQTMSYSIDIYRRKLAPTRSPLDFALFVAFFPQLVAGPIVRAASFLPQLRLPIHVQFSTFAVLMICGGLLKKVLVADRLAPYVDGILGNPEAFGSASIIAATLAFSTQIYCDFSGYSEIAIGLGSILGFRLPVNFDRPYFALNPREFWQKWHISLSTWLRDYLYISLGGNRGGLWLTLRNLMLTMLLGGLWHGAGWNFVLWGGWHGLLLAAHRLARPLAALPAVQSHARAWPARLAAWAVMQYCVLVSWLLFRVTNSADLAVALRKFFVFEGGLRPTMPGGLHLSLLTATLGLFWLVHAILRATGLRERLAEKPVIYAYGMIVATTILLVLFWPSRSTPFIYFQF
jgi:alginate O-acetyltransferase complex protein AlgI